MTPRRTIIGVDAGGTKTIARIAAIDGDHCIAVLGEGRAGSGNPRSVGGGQALQNIERAIQLAWAQSQQQRCIADCIVLGIAGGGGDEFESRLANWLRRDAIARTIQSVADYRLIVPAAFGTEIGVGVVAGTGSVAFGNDGQGNSAVVGGWGYLFGDEGSAFAVGRAGLMAATRCADGRGPQTELVPELHRFWETREPAEWKQRVYESLSPREAIAGLAPVVIQTAGCGDRVSMGILDNAASDLCDMIMSVVGRLGFAGGGYSLAIAGGLLVGVERLRERVIDQLRHQGLAPGA
ncbi:MAG: hypothetical protein KDA99_05310, partial [Planctomycetales bacterium]|nr:hypothetical protein [Planctomycetales bacterium]